VQLTLPPSDRRRIARIRRDGVAATMLAAAVALLLWIGEPLALTPRGPPTNYIEVTPTIATAGMPTRRQLRQIVEGDFAAVVNLAPSGVTGGIDDEQAIVEGARLLYVQVPVDFSRPLARDFRRFSQVMRDLQGRRVFVHCQMNMRASVFVFLYRAIELGTDPDVAFEAVQRVWQPNAVWTRFISGELGSRKMHLPVALG